MAKSAYLECGKIINTHGFRGDVKLESWCDTPSVLARLRHLYFKEGDSFSGKRVIHASVFRQFVLMHLEGIDDEDSARRLKETVVYAAREEIPLAPGAYFLADLTGLPVLDATTGENYGVLREVINRGASDIYVIRKTNGGEAMIPAVPEFVKRVDTDSGIYIAPIGGMLDDDETV